MVPWRYLLVVYVVVNLCDAAELPPTWVRCKVSPSTDNKRNKCLESTLGKILTEVAKNKGEPSLSLPNIDPMKIKKMTIVPKSSDGPVNIKFDIKNVDVYGFSHLRIKHAKGKLSSSKDWKMELDLKVKNLTVFGDYKVEGKVLVLPIVGEGKCNITFVNASAEAIWTGQPQSRNADMMKLTSFYLDVNTTRMSMHLENLFNGDKKLGDNMNKFLNENWSVVFQELKGSIQSELGQEIMKYSKRVMEKIDFDNLFIVES